MSGGGIGVGVMESQGSFEAGWDLGLQLRAKRGHIFQVSLEWSPPRSTGHSGAGSRTAHSLLRDNGFSGARVYHRHLRFLDALNRTSVLVALSRLSHASVR